MAQNPFLAALTEGGKWRGVVPALFGMGRIREQQEAEATFASELSRLMGPQQPPMGVPPVDPMSGATFGTAGPVGGGVNPVMGGVPDPAMAGPMGAGAPAQAQAAGMDPARALLEVFAKNPRLIAELPEDAFANATTLIQLFQAQNPGAAPTAQMQNFQAALAAGAQISPQQAASGFGFGEPEKVVVARALTDILKRPPTDAELQNYFNLVQQGGSSTTVNVGAPDMGPVFEFLDKGDVSARQNELSGIDKALFQLNDAIDLTSHENASFFFGPLAQLGELAAPFSQPLNTLLGSEGNRPLIFAGPDSQTLGGARATIRNTMIQSAQAVLGGDIGRLSNKEREMVNGMLANPDGWLTSPAVARGAFQQLQSFLQLTRRRTAQELQQGGVSSTLPEVTMRTPADWEAIKVIAERLQAENPTLPVATIMDNAEKEYDTQKSGAPQ